MPDNTLFSEPTLRLSIFLGVFAIIALWEVVAPRRDRLYSRMHRWPSNLGISLINSIMLRLIAPAASVGIAVFVGEQQWGALNNITLPSTVAILLAIILLDLAIYFQHRFFHVIPFFWKFHRMHHTDLDFDTTTAIRFHPIEILFSSIIKLTVIVLLGPPVIAVFYFEVLLNATAMFNHGNIKMPGKLDVFLRMFLVTPDMHRIHHSNVITETNSNFGFNLPWWDRLFGTYQADPAAGHTDMHIGIKQFPHAGELRLLNMLSHPFRKPESEAIDRA